MRTLLALIALVVVTAAGCSSGKPGSCKTGVLDDKAQLCIDYTDGERAKAFKPTCATVMKGAWSESMCVASDSLGGCQTRDGKSTMWIIKSERHPDTDAARAHCEKMLATYVDPPGPTK